MQDLRERLDAVEDWLDALEEIVEWLVQAVAVSPYVLKRSAPQSINPFTGKFKRP